MQFTHEISFEASWFFWPLSTQGTGLLILGVNGSFMSSLTEGSEQFAGGRLGEAQQIFEYMVCPYF